MVQYKYFSLPCVILLQNELWGGGDGRCQFFILIILFHRVTAWNFNSLKTSIIQCKYFNLPPDILVQDKQSTVPFLSFVVVLLLRVMAWKFNILKILISTIKIFQSAMSYLGMRWAEQGTNSKFWWYYMSLIYNTKFWHIWHQLVR